MLSVFIVDIFLVDVDQIFRLAGCTGDNSIIKIEPVDPSLNFGLRVGVVIYPCVSAVIMFIDPSAIAVDCAYIALNMASLQI